LFDPEERQFFKLQFEWYRECTKMSPVSKQRLWDGFLFVKQNLYLKEIEK